MDSLLKQMVQSPVWSESSETRVVWMTLLALMDATGRVRLSVKEIAQRANLDTSDCLAALRVLESTHIESSADGWIVTERRLWVRQRGRERVRRFRERQRQSLEEAGAR